MAAPLGVQRQEPQLPSLRCGAKSIRGNEVPVDDKLFCLPEPSQMHTGAHNRADVNTSLSRRRNEEAYASDKLPRVNGLDHGWLHVMLFLGILNPIVVGLIFLHKYGVFSSTE